MFLNLIWLFLYCVPRGLFFISIQFFVLNFDGWLLLLFCSKFMIFWYLILFVYIYNYNNRISAIICCCISGCMHSFFGLRVGSSICVVVDIVKFLPVLFVAVFLIFFPILFPTRSLIAYAVFWIPFFQAVLRALFANFFVAWRSFYPYLHCRKDKFFCFSGCMYNSFGLLVGSCICVVADIFESSPVFFVVVFLVFFAIVFPTKSLVASAVLWMALF